MHLRILTFTLLAALISACAHQPPKLQFKEVQDASAPHPTFHWPDPRDDLYRQLRQRYDLERVVASAGTDYERVQTVATWVHRRWKHTPVNSSSPSDTALSILERAEKGERFRCVEYAMVSAGVLNSLGIPSRVLYLEGAGGLLGWLRIGGHAVAEAYLRDEGRWIMLDGQWDAIPVLAGRPLNAVELQEAIAAQATDLAIVSGSGTETGKYLQWVAPYLYYFAVRFDQRYEHAQAERSYLRLTEIGAEGRDERLTYVHDPAVFYRAPTAALVRAATL